MNKEDSKSEPLKLKPVKIPLWKIWIMIKSNTFRGSLEHEEIEYNLAYGLYPKKYEKRVKRLLGDKRK